MKRSEFDLKKCIKGPNFALAWNLYSFHKLSNTNQLVCIVEEQTNPYSDLEASKWVESGS